jgi:hypothetical protein
MDLSLGTYGSAGAGGGGVGLATNIRLRWSRLDFEDFRAVVPPAAIATG